MFINLMSLLSLLYLKNSGLCMNGLHKRGSQKR